MADSPTPSLTMLTEAKRLIKENQFQPARQYLLDSLRQSPQWMDALLWLAKISPDYQEARAAIDLALILAPQNETAQRGSADVRARFANSPEIIQKIDLVGLTGMTRTQARNVVYPFRGLRRPMGVLLDEGQIHLNDLVYAAQEAKEDHLRRAARTLLLAELLRDQVQVPTRPLNFVRGAEFTSYRERRALLFAGLLFGATFILFALGGVFTILNVVAALNVLPFGASFALGLSGLGLILLAYGFGEWGTRYADEKEQFSAGRKGEERVADVLRATLNSPWTLIQNFEWKDRKRGDIDLVLLGPAGIWAMEVKSFANRTRNIGDRWEYRGRWRWHSVARNPGKQARRNAVELKEFLTNNGVPSPFVNPIVIWAGEDDSLEIQNPMTPVWKLNELEQRATEFNGSGLKPEQVERAVKLLVQQIDEVKAEIAQSK